MAATVIEEDLVDEYRLNIMPVILGSGKSFFQSQHTKLSLEVINTKLLSCGVIIARYKRLKR